MIFATMVKVIGHTTSKLFSDNQILETFKKLLLSISISVILIILPLDQQSLPHDSIKKRLFVRTILFPQENIYTQTDKSYYTKKITYIISPKKDYVRNCSITDVSTEDYLISTFPVISLGASIPMIFKIVGATSARIPFSILASLFEVTYTHGTGFKE